MQKCEGRDPEKTNVTTKCWGQIYRCGTCGAVGCDKTKCTNQNFAFSKCMKCGANPARKQAL